MNKRTGKVVKFLSAAGLLAVAAEAGVPLNGLRGYVGVAFTRWPIRPERMRRERRAAWANG